MNPRLRSVRARALRRALARSVVALCASAAYAADDAWLVLVDGGLEAIDGGWSEKSGRVIFTRVGGTLSSMRADDVDLATSSFITWQLDGRRHPPPRAPLEQAPAGESATPTPCIGAVMTRLLNGESFEVTIGDAREIVHVACLDTPESNQSIPALGWFGRAALSAIEIEVKQGGLTVCLGEQAPPQRDGDGHRIVSIQLADGRDLATSIIEGGFAVLRPNDCRDGAHYRAAEDLAIREQRGLWGRSGAQPAFQAVQIGAAVAPAKPRASGGCRLRR